MYSQKTIETLRKRLLEETQKAKAKEKIVLHVSKGNVKIGKCLNVSNAPLITCNNCKECQYYCYDVKACLQYSNVLTARVENTALLIKDMDKYFCQLWSIMAKRRKNKFLRFHVSGDIINYKHMQKIIDTARLFPDFKIWTYTKNYRIVNQWLKENGGKKQFQKIYQLCFQNGKACQCIIPIKCPFSLVKCRTTKAKNIITCLNAPAIAILVNQTIEAV